MTDQLLNSKLNKWFWYCGVLPLTTSYLICLNFTAEFIDISLVERPSTTLFYMGELLGYTTLGLAIIMIFWCNINAMQVHKISSKITKSEFRIKKYILNTSVIFFPVVAFFGFVPFALILFDKKLFIPLFPIIEPIAQKLTPYLFPVYLVIKSFVKLIFTGFSSSYY